MVFHKIPECKTAKCCIKYYTKISDMRDDQKKGKKKDPEFMIPCRCFGSCRVFMLGTISQMENLRKRKQQLKGRIQREVWRHRRCKGKRWRLPPLRTEMKINEKHLTAVFVAKAGIWLGRDFRWGFCISRRISVTKRPGSAGSLNNTKSTESRVWCRAVLMAQVRGRRAHYL